MYAARPTARSLATLAIGAIAGATSPGLAQPFTVPWHTIDSGGGTSSGGGFTVRGTIGQSDAAGPLTGGGFTVLPGFWPGVTATPACEGDLNGDGFLDLGDIQSFIALFLVQDLAVDFNGDAIVDLGDIQAFVAIFLAGC